MSYVFSNYYVKIDLCKTIQIIRRTEQCKDMYNFVKFRGPGIGICQIFGGIGIKKGNFTGWTQCTAVSLSHCLFEK